MLLRMCHSLSLILFIVIRCNYEVHLTLKFEFSYRQPMKISSQVKKLFFLDSSAYNTNLCLIGENR